MIESMRPMLQKGDLYMGLPWAFSGPMLYSNDDLLTANGVDPEALPSSWESLRQTEGPKYLDATGDPLLWRRYEA